RRGGGTGDLGEGGDALPPRPDLRTDRGTVASGQHRAGPQQRAPRRPDRRRHRTRSPAHPIVSGSATPYIPGRRLGETRNDIRTDGTGDRAAPSAATARGHRPPAGELP